MRKLILPLVTLALAPALGACESSVVASPGFGDAVNHNVAMQVINPDPHPGAEPPPEASGRRIADAIERYQSGTVTEPQPMNTSNINIRQKGQ